MVLMKRVQVQMAFALLLIQNQRTRVNVLEMETNYVCLYSHRSNHLNPLRNTCEWLYLMPPDTVDIHFSLSKPSVLHRYISLCAARKRKKWSNKELNYCGANWFCENQTENGKIKAKQTYLEHFLFNQSIFFTAIQFLLWYRLLQFHALRFGRAKLGFGCFAFRLIAMICFHGCMQFLQYAQNFFMCFIANFAAFFVDALHILDDRLQAGHQMGCIDFG